MAEKEIVYRFDVERANQHFARIRSWYTAKPEDRRVITGDAHDDYVHTLQPNGFIGGSVPRNLLIPTDEDADELRAAFEATLTRDSERK